MIALVFAALLASPAHAGCAALQPVPEALQVAWVSPTRRQVGARAPVTVVGSVALQKLAKERAGDLGAVLRALGLLGARQEPDDDWKVTFFDVHRSSLCRPVDETLAEAGLAGVPRCADDNGAGEIRRKGWSGCGYLLDTASGARSLDVFRITWRVAVAQGFCVLPLPRFLRGRPD